MAGSSLADQLAQAFKHGHKMGSSGGPATALISPGDQGRYTKAEVKYRTADTPGESCGDCQYFDGVKTCQIVTGPISESMVCDKFEPTDTATQTGSADSTAITAPGSGPTG